MSLNDDDRNETITEWGPSCWRQSSTSNVRQHNGWCGSKVNDATPNSIFFDAIPSPLCFLLQKNVFLPRLIISPTPPTTANKSLKNKTKNKTKKHTSFQRQNMIATTGIYQKRRNRFLRAPFRAQPLISGMCEQWKRDRQDNNTTILLSRASQLMNFFVSPSIRTKTTSIISCCCCANG